MATATVIDPQEDIRQLFGTPETPPAQVTVDSVNPEPTPAPVEETQQPPNNPTPEQQPAQPESAEPQLTASPDGGESQPTPEQPTIDYKTAYESLVAEMDRMAGEQLAADKPAQPAPTQTQQQAPVASAVVQPVPTEQSPTQFIPEDKYEEILTDPKKFNEVLRQVVIQTAAKAQEAALERVYRELPDLLASDLPGRVIGSQVQNHMAAQVVSTKFFEENQDMQTVPQNLFQAEYRSVRASDPTKPLIDVLNTTRDRIRQKLHLPIPSTAVKTIPITRPATLPGGSTQRSAAPAKPKLNGIAADIQAVLQGRG